MGWKLGPQCSRVQKPSFCRMIESSESWGWGLINGLTNQRGRNLMASLGNGRHHGTEHSGNINQAKLFLLEVLYQVTCPRDRKLTQIWNHVPFWVAPVSCHPVTSCLDYESSLGPVYPLVYTYYLLFTQEPSQLSEVCQGITLTRAMVLIIWMC